MIGALTAGKKAVTFGYKRYGIPGAIASGGIALAGYIAVRRALQAATDADEDSLGAAVDADTLEAAIDRGGLEAVTDVETLEAAIDRDQLRSNVDVDELRSSVGEDVDEFTDVE
ncbi:hypothetical protein RBH26_00585 [Natronolimnohabitans sp. A-GB9]|uniref:hypothetical protein n=1 Tax=Natronolimnohabitans sp. A-GB9 TaxID=3069757 RepID=UPI0027AFACDC|nr:hypothetical protein [Natronolimnohabitans sp. A-GB9]MDQ2048972.1 hypothetical protein [Natronolimnohabitans sp. A-GB9]